jgi:tetratricopeptide (TPR) repeat protein
MKKIIGTLAIYASLAMVALASFANVSELKAQTPTPSPAAVAAQGTCTEEAKTPLYAEFTKFRTTDTPKAFEAAKKYLAICQQDDQYTSYLKKWTAAYDKENRKVRFQPLLYGEKKYDEAFALGKQILADEPENLRVLIDLGYAGFHLAAPATKNESFNADSLTYSRKAIQMLEAGKVPESLDGKASAWNPFKGKEDTLAYLYHGVGRLTFKTNPEEALSALIKALSFETDLRKEAWEYYFIAASYETGPYPKLAAEYEKFKGKEETPESKLALANINQVIDRMIDAYARAVSLAGSDPKYAVPKKAWMEGLTTWYKFRHNQSDAGLDGLIASVMSTPLPPVPTAITVLPAAPAATTTPTPGSDTSSSGSTMAPGSAALPTTNKTTTTTTAVSPAVAPAPKTTTTTAVATTSKKPPVKPKTRNNHRRH